MKTVRAQLHWWVLGTLFATTIVIWYCVFRENRGGVLTVAFLDIGQGDSIYIEAPNGNQLLVDGGPPTNVVLKRLGEVMPFYDRTIDAVVATHPDQDHIGGLAAVLHRYRVGTVLEPGVSSDTAAYQGLEKAIADTGTPRVLARRGMRIVLSPAVSFDILFPDRDTTGWETNTASIVGRLVYGNESFMLTGDSPQAIEEYLVSVNGANLKSTVLKAGHHGSRTSSAPDFVGFVAPEYGIISAGKNNQYGHPHQETLDTLARFGVKILRTDERGTIMMKSDGETIRIVQ